MWQSFNLNPTMQEELAEQAAFYEVPEAEVISFALHLLTYTNRRLQAASGVLFMNPSGVDADRSVSGPVLYAFDLDHPVQIAQLAQRTGGQLMRLALIDPLQQPARHLSPVEPIE